MDTEVGGIAELLEATTDDPSPLQLDLARVSKLLGITVVAIAVLVMVVTVIANGVETLSDAVTVLLLGVSLAVAAVPEGLPAILSVVLAIGVQRMAGRGAVVKHLHSVETLGSATVMASDKTGTLTRNEMTVERVLTASGEVRLTGTGYRAEGRPEALSGSLEDAALTVELELVLLGGVLANNAAVTETDDDVEVHGDPTEAAFVVAARKLAGLEARAEAFERRGEIPFTSERKLMSSVDWHDPISRLGIVTKGGADVVLGRCTAVQHGDEVVPLSPAERTRILAGVERLSGEAYRVLGVAYSWFPPEQEAEVLDRLGTEDASDLEHDLVWVGAVGLIDPPRAEVSQSIAEAQRAGVRVLMITGDHPATAARIATDLGIAEPGSRGHHRSPAGRGRSRLARRAGAVHPGVRAGGAGPQAGARARAAGGRSGRRHDRRRRERRARAEGRRHRRGDGHHRHRGDQARRPTWCWPTTTSPPSSRRCGRVGGSSPTSASSCATCSRRTSARCCTVFVGVRVRRARSG